MKTTLALLALLVIGPASARAQGARLQLDSLERLTRQAAETVNLSIDASMLQFASAFLNGNGDQAAVKALISGLKGIYVRSFEFDRENGYTAADVDAIRKQLTGPGWSRLVSTDSKREREIVDIYSWRDGDTSAGLAIVVAEPMELTVVNIVGPIDLSKLPLLQGQFGIPRIPAEAGPPGR